ncbi:putative Hybrid NRPS/PKS enzyme [Taphrina deformans PYCC 5710]|uniref:Hybrid NRPS/PKS enzyme n=1 Tax=Taphrina deformans (strain PYCC 5710 / ATCC 11124 / CBS 356.35 / IMI 108563 / JCM 9778 / NBRC 8474) TaxID=1097556 RepID=R4X8X1_TAPDE|nr:putative Hybrid NRPS/PKS enzyme [Taphrina deformans PYCC 5710]|eukprot:CCG80587.1 putative Hybrid NRPS/PKS enzyme [Taphrina deformans PYCC 5710]
MGLKIDTKRDLSTLFTLQARETPDLIALEDVGATYTYAEVLDRVEKLAKRIRSLGVKRDSLVGVLLPRSADYVIACLAALKAGGAFLVLELAYPPELLADVIEDATPTVVITKSSETNRFKEGTTLVVLDGPVEKHNEDILLPDLSKDNDLERLAFVAYSSGTTGRPKGIANPHRAAVLSYDLRFGLSDLQQGDRVACNVFFVWEIIRPLLRGATVVAVADEVSYDPVALIELLATKKVTETLMTPTLLAAALSRHEDLGTMLPDLRTLWLNGEVVTTELARRALKALPRVRLLNCYSACETHEIACGDIAKIVDEKNTYCPTGPPLDPKYIYILNDSGQRVDSGISGELYIGGPLLARGYLNRPETTAQAFLPDQFDGTPGARMYKTGDLARLLPSGLLEITGRVGAMIKLRGYSVVPGKVESAILAHLAVRQCAVVAHGDGLDRQLVAYIVRDKENAEKHSNVEISESGHSPASRKVLAPYLAQYMIPALWVELQSLPTHQVSGKSDLKNLPPPPKADVATEPTPVIERDSIEIDAIALIWAATLKIARHSISPEHSFFDLGGHSLSIADLASRLSKTFGLKIPVARLADPPTLNGHVQTIREIRDGQIAAVQADLPAILRADSTLDSSFQPRGATLRSIKQSETVLLTGATGFLGAFLLNDLLETTSAKVICLVRFAEPSADDVPAGIARIRKNLIDLGLWHDSIMDRVEILPGNLSRKRLGLSSGEFSSLANRVQLIIHAAATVNLVYPYAALRSANVEGTREILRLASIGGATVHYVSSNGVLPPATSRNGQGWPEDAMLYVDVVPDKIPDGYGQTKWVAEQLVYEAGRRGLPVKIHRAGTISGHSATGAANPWDLLTALFVESIRLGYAPDVEGWRAEMTPVDFVSRSIVHLADQTQAKQLVFHIGDPDPVDTKQVFRFLADLGYPTQPLPWEEWAAKWTEKRGSVKGGEGNFTVDILRSGMPSIEFLRDIVVLDNAQTRPYRALIERPKVDSVLMETYARHWFARGWLPRSPTGHAALGGSAHSTRKSILTGKVAVVTGASSGIGAAVAVALAREGCHIALGARRQDALEAVKRRMVVREGKVILRSTDVTDRKQVESLMKAAETELGPVDILVSCAGVMYFTMMANNHIDDWDRTVDVNCKGLLNCLSTTVPSMLSRGAGHIVAISSDAGRKVFPGLGVYSASKFFVEATLQSLRLETAGKGLRVTSVQPGNTATELLGMSSDAEALQKYGEPTGAKVLEPEDVASSIIYALKQPDYVAVNEVLIEPRDEPI